MIVGLDCGNFCCIAFHKQAIFNEKLYITCVLVNKNAAVYIEVEHGGHLGFYEGGKIYPNPTSWCDRVAIDLVGAFISHEAKPLQVISSLRY